MLARVARKAITLGVATALAMTATASGALTGTETLQLDTYESPNVGVAGPVTTQETLAGGEYYTAIVSGTFSAFIPRLWTPGGEPGWTVCGAPTAAPTTPSPGRPDTNAGQDAEVQYARPWPSPCPHTMPFAYRQFQVNGGSGFGHLQAIDGPHTGPRADHTYRYLIRGTGSIASFRQVDSYTPDNTGVLTIVVRRAVLEECGANTECQQRAAAGSATTADSGARRAVDTAASSLGLPSARQCLGRRRFQIRIRSHRRDPVVRASVRLNNRQLRVTRKRVRGVRRFTTTIDLRRVTKTRVTVRISVKLRSGKTIVGVRRYYTCTPRRPGGSPPV